MKKTPDSGERNYHKKVERAEMSYVQYVQEGTQI